MAATYKIEKSPVDLFSWETKLHSTKFFLATTWILWTVYMLLQFFAARSLQKETKSFQWRLWVAIFAEFCLSFQELVYALSLILSLFGASNNRPRPSLRLTGNEAPSVAVLITCCGEPIENIINTVSAAATQNYPVTSLSVFVLDDGHDETLQRAIEALNLKSAKRGWANVSYLSRRVKPGTKSFFKAGNLQFGIDETKRKGNSDILAGLDADMIPQKDWLRKMIPHLLVDAETALAIPPQDYYNVPKGDPLGQRADFSMYFTLQEPLNDRLDAAMCTGTGYVVKRKALENIGGWPLAETGEDFMCSSMLSDHGWKIAFVRETLQLGLAPNSLKGLLKQRMRWQSSGANMHDFLRIEKTDAGIEVHQHFNFYLPGSKVSSKMTLGQRAVGMLYVFRDYAPLTNILALILLPLALLSSGLDERVPVSRRQQPESLRWMQVAFLLFYITQKINLYKLYHHVGLSQVLNFQSNEIWAAPWMAVRCVASFLPTRYNPATFTVCGTVISTLNERFRQHRQSLLRRVTSPEMLMFSAYILYASMPLMAQLNLYNSAGSTKMRSLHIPFSGIWVKLVRSISNVTVPLRYMIWPPTVPNWTELMEEDKDGVKRPRKGWDNNGNGNETWWIGTLILELCIIWWCWV